MKLVILLSIKDESLIGDDMPKPLRVCGNNVVIDHGSATTTASPSEKHIAFLGRGNDFETEPPPPKR